MGTGSLQTPWTEGANSNLHVIPSYILPAPVAQAQVSGAEGEVEGATRDLVIGLS
ncbi:MAG: hypothetical protein GTO14_16605 [Anaerolineales bacterium]|nr:hypothetical protein [Anaerolineales bacterium]